MLALLVVCAGVVWSAVKPGQALVPMHAPLPAPAVAPQARAAAPAAAQARPARLVYRYSVIPGGVRNAAELAAAVQRDPVLAAHYAGFDITAAQLLRVEAPRLVHVSYRVGDKIYWTSKKVRLEPGEYVLSDGKHLVRARCGNRIADDVPGPVQDKEPAPEVLDQAFASAEDLLDLPAGGGAPALAQSFGQPFAQPAAAGGTPDMQAVLPVAMPAFPNLWAQVEHEPSPQFHALVVDEKPPVTKPPATPPAPPETTGGKPPEAVPGPGTPTPPRPVPVPGPGPGNPPQPVPVPGPGPGNPPQPTPTPDPGTVTRTRTPVPEPGSAWLVGIALAALAATRRRRQA